MNRNLIKQARGAELADLVFKNCKVINVFTKTIEIEDVAISNGIILGTGKYFGKKEIDCKDFFVSPGFIDGHVHIESSMLTPTGYAKVVMPKGTTSVIADCHEIANVCGKPGVRYMIDSADRTPLDVFMMIPSCVPSTPFETSGAVLNSKDLIELKKLKNVLGLGEMMNYPGVISGDPETHDKLDAYHDRIIDGHVPSVFGKDLNAYILSGIYTDHESTSPLELIDKVKKGMYIHLREGSQTRNVIDLLPAVSNDYSNRLMFCSDDLHPSDIIKDGHINNNINIASKHGLNPITAIQMATINIATCYNLKNYGAIAPGYYADLVFFEDIKNIQPKYVYKKGKLVAKKGKPLFDALSLVDKNVENTVNMNLDNFDYSFNLKFDIVNVIQLVKNNVITRKHVEQVELIDGDINLKKSDDLLKLFVIERHHATGNVGKALISGYGLKNAAIALSIAHDSHNVIVVGDNEKDVSVAINKIQEIQGGIVLVRDGEVFDSLNLEVAGIMTNKDAVYVKDKLENMEKEIRKLGVKEDIDDPFLVLAFLSLPVIPDIKCTDMGLFDVRKFKIISIEAGEDE